MTANKVLLAPATLEFGDNACDLVRNGRDTQAYSLTNAVIIASVSHYRFRMVGHKIYLWLNYHSITMAKMPLPSRAAFATLKNIGKAGNHRKVNGMFETSYSHVEAALARAYAVPDKAVGAFRGRLGNLQKQGLFGARNMPGRGAALRYGPDQFHRLIFACELFEFGVGPATVLELVEALWETRIARIFEKAEKAAQNDPGHHDIVMQLGGVHLMTASWSDAVPNINSCTLVKLPDHIRLWMGMGVGDRVAARALTVNLSSRLRVLHRALADAHSAEIEAENKRRKGVSKVRLKR